MSAVWAFEKDLCDYEAGSLSGLAGRAVYYAEGSRTGGVTSRAGSGLGSGPGNGLMSCYARGLENTKCHDDDIFGYLVRF